MNVWWYNYLTLSRNVIRYGLIVLLLQYIVNIHGVNCTNDSGKSNLSAIQSATFKMINKNHITA